jgi:hypothetical protein
VGWLVGYEIYIWPKADKPTTRVNSFANAFVTAGIPTKVETDKVGCWLVFPGHESALSLEVKDAAVTGGGMKLIGLEDPVLVDKIVRVLCGLGWSAGDDEGEIN